MNLHPLLTAVGFKNLDEAWASHLTDLAAETILNNALATIADHLTEGEMSDVERLLEDQDHQPLINYLASRKINFESLLVQEAHSYDQMLLTASATMRGGAHE